MDKKIVYRPLTQQESISLKARRSGDSESKAFLKGYPAAMRWKPMTIETKSMRFFLEPKMRYYLKYATDDELTTGCALKKIHHSVNDGRRNKYKPDYAQKMIDYFSVDPVVYTEVEDTKTSEITRTKTIANLPTLAGFCCSIKIHRDTLHDWLKKVTDTGEKIYPELCEAYKMAKEFQEYILVVNTLNGNYNAGFAKFVAQNLLDWRESKDLVLRASNDAATKVITKDMTPEDAALIYQESLKIEDKS